MKLLPAQGLFLVYSTVFCGYIPVYSGFFCIFCARRYVIESDTANLAYHTVVEELIGNVTLEKNGLATRHNVRFKMTRNKEDIWFHLGSSEGEKLNFLISASYASTYDSLYYASLVSHKSGLSPYGRIWSITPNLNHFKLYSKKTESRVDYYVNITTDWVSLRILSIYIDNTSSIVVKEIETPNIEELTEIPIQNIGGIYPPILFQ